MGHFAGRQVLAREDQGRQAADQIKQHRCPIITKRLSSGTPTLNWIGAELGIQLEAMQVGEVIAHHLPGRLNDMADWLSRPDTTGAMPKGLDA